MTKLASLRVLIVAGGTGGHVFPALAIAEQLTAMGATVIWLGTGGMERRWVTQYPLHIVSFRSPVNRVMGALRLAVAVCRAWGVVMRQQPAVVLAMGSYASVPGGIAARLSGKPLLIHEQNAVAGRANRLLARFATLTLTGFPAVFPKGRYIGNPVRQSFVDDAAAKGAAEKSSDTLRLLVLGGSQGANALNEVVPAALALLPAAVWHVRHQCGAGNGGATLKAYEGGGGASFLVEEFIDNVAVAMREADLVICRAGASTLAELAMTGVAAVLVPYPHAAADHQRKNAEFFEANKAAVMCDEKTLTPVWLADFLQRITRDESRTMAVNCRALAKPTAAADIADCCVREVRQHAA